MEYPNAKTGISKIFIGELLTLVSAVISIFTIFLMYRSGGTLGAAAGSVTSSPMMRTLVICAGVLTLAAFILTMIGISNAAKDEANFKNAISALFVGVIAAIAQSPLQTSSPLVGGFCGIVGTFCEFLVTFFVISGTLNLARKVHDRKVQALGLFTMKLILIIYAVILILNVITMVLSMRAADTASTAAGLIGSAAALVAYLFYLRLLNRARMMF